jgi:hypothetical protein
VISAKQVLLATFLVVGGLVATAAVYEYRHPCLRYSAHRVFVPEMTTFMDVNGGNSNAAKGGVSMPMTTPAHYEAETVCEDRK